MVHVQCVLFKPDIVELMQCTVVHSTITIDAFIPIYTHVAIMPMGVWTEFTIQGWK